MKGAAQELGLRVFQPSSWKLPETRALWDSLSVDLAIVVAYGHILPSWMLEACPLGVWNLHFSLLPKWRGAAPVNHAILAGDSETGVALMRITPGLDAGPVLAMNRRPITLADSAPGLLAALAEDAGILLGAHLPALLAGTARPEVQDDSRVTFAPKLGKEMSKLDGARPAEELHRQVRALQPWPGVEFLLKDTLVKVCGVGDLRASGDAQGTLRWDRSGVWLTGGDGNAVEFTQLQRPGKPIQTALQALQPWGGKGSWNT